MKILVTGAAGFIGKNLIAELRNKGYEVFKYDVDTELELLDKYCKESDFVFHLAGVNRPKEESEFVNGNVAFTKTLLDALKKYSNNCPVMFSSSVQAELSNPYGESKRVAEDLIRRHNKETNAKILIYRFPNAFGKWCKPNYNSVVATFCYNIANELPICINNQDTVLNLIYIDDIVKELLNAVKGNENRNNSFCEVSEIYNIRLGKIADLLYSFRESRKNLMIPDMSDIFIKKLYSTYLSYLPKDKFIYDLNTNSDIRGSFTEFIKTPDSGQVSINVCKPNISKGNHWHHTKNEKFMVVSGNGLIKFREIDSDKIIEYFVSSEKLQVVDIPPGYIHSIENIGDTDLITVMWANELFDPNNSDTYQA